MLVLALYFTGGLTNANHKLAQYKPPAFGTARLTLPKAFTEEAIPRGTWLETEDGQLVRTGRRVEVDSDEINSVEILMLRTELEQEAVNPQLIRRDIQVEILKRDPYAYGADVEGVYLRPPGPDPGKADGFLAIGIAFSFFVFWPFGSSGQPSNMVRLMAFRDTRTLRMSIIAVSVYFSVIYFSLVIIFCCAKVLIPGMEINPDRIMPEMAVQSTTMAGVPWLAGILLAAPFAAVMSSVDSFLLVVSSSLVRDIYQRYINPSAHESQLKRVTYGGTITIGLLATLAALYPPRYLQDIIVIASGGLAASFLVPMAFSLYWRRATAAGIITGMIVGCLTHFLLTFVVSEEVRLGLLPFVWDVTFSALAVIVVSLLTKPPRDEVIRRYFDVD